MLPTPHQVSISLHYSPSLFSYIYVSFSFKLKPFHSAFTTADNHVFHASPETFFIFLNLSHTQYVVLKLHRCFYPLPTEPFIRRISF